MQQTEVKDQSKVLENLTKEFEDETAKLEQLKANVQEIKTNIVKLREQSQITENGIQEKQKAKDDITENSSKRDSMIAYYQKNIKTLTDAMVKYEVNFITGRGGDEMKIRCLDAFYLLFFSVKWKRFRRN